MFPLIFAFTFYARYFDGEKKSPLRPAKYQLLAIDKSTNSDKTYLFFCNSDMSYNEHSLRRKIKRRSIAVELLEGLAARVIPPSDGAFCMSQ